MVKPSEIVAAGERGISKLGRGIANTFRRTRGALKVELEAHRIAEGQMAELRLAERNKVEAAEIANRAEQIIDARDAAVVYAELKAQRRGAVRLFALGHYDLAASRIETLKALEAEHRSLLHVTP